MIENMNEETASDIVSRRGFVKASAAAGAASLLASCAHTGRHAHHVEGIGKIRVGLIGCGGRGTGAGIIDCANATSGVELVAIGDIFQDHLDAAPARIKGNLAKRKLPVDDIYKVTPETSFSGIDAYQKVIDCGVDMVILTTPPYFRPEYFRAAVAAGKHVFVEKPIAVDPTGVRAFIETAEEAKRKGLTVVAGTQMRRARHIMAFMDRLHKGGIGDIVGGQVVRRGGGLMNWGENESKRRSAWSDVEWQLRRWLFVNWLSGDFIVEQHVHNLDLLNWAMQSTPETCMAMGGRQARVGPEYGNIFDHCSAELMYPNDVRIEYMGSQIDGISGRNNLRFSGTRGTGTVDFATCKIEGRRPFVYDGPSVKPQVQEYADMIDAIRTGEPINEGKQVADSTMTAIMIRMSAYTGRSLKWDWCVKASKLELGPEKMAFSDFEMNPVAVPGTTKLV
jgi:predicted dehydrogenase